MKGPKVTVIGAGSYFFGKPVIHKCAASPVMAGGTLALVDTNKDVLGTMMKLARRMFKETGCGVKVVGSTDRRKALPDSDFVVLTFSEKNAYYRGIDTRIAAKHGIRMCSSDTIGPGGIFRALRELPRIVEMARDVERLAPDAWLINFVNPTAVIGMGLRRYAPNVRSFALCDGNHEPHNTLRRCKWVGLLPEDATSVPPEMMTRLDLRIGGVNHCTWMVRFTYDGKDMMPAFKRTLRKWAREEQDSPPEKSKPRYNHEYALKLYDLYGAFPTAVSHTKEYVPFFQGYGVKPVRPEPLRCFDAELRAEEMKRAWGETERYANGDLGVEHFLENVADDHATDIMESMWGGLGKCFWINTSNCGAVTNLPDDAFLELRCDVDLNGVRPHPFGDMPVGLRALQQQILDAHEVAAEAAMTGSKKTLLRAMMTDPLCNNIEDAKACMKELLEAEREALPEWWFK